MPLYYSNTVQRQRIINFMFKKREEKSGVSIEDVLNKKKNLLPEHVDRPWVVQWMFYFVGLLLLVFIYSLIQFYQ